MAAIDASLLMRAYNPVGQSRSSCLESWLKAGLRQVVIVRNIVPGFKQAHLSQAGESLA